MSTAITPVPADPAPTSTHPLDAAKLEVAHASARLQAINQELERLAVEKAKALAQFNFACARMAELQNKHQEKEATK